MTDCKAWWKNPGVNPNTGRKINIDGPTYKKLLIECGPSPLNNNSPPSPRPTKPVKPVKPVPVVKPDKPAKPVKPTKPDKPAKPDKAKPTPQNVLFPPSHCKSWWEVPCVNPVTKKKLKMNGPVYNKLLAECGPPRKDNLSPRQDNVSPRQDSLSIESLGSSRSSNKSSTSVYRKP